MLNEKQKEAIDIIDKPLIVIAGPGTGKTTLICEKIDYLINKKNISPDRILALTFTEKATEEMSSRVMSKGMDFYAKTFHSFALEIIDKYLGKISNIDENYILLDDTNQLIYFMDNLDSFKFSSVDPSMNKQKVVYELKSTISRLKDFGVTLMDMQNVDFSSMNVKMDILSIYSKYEMYKKENNFLDFGDILLYLSKLLEDSEILEEVLDMYDYVLVDEFQDTNLMQLNILKKICKNNITVVGDLKQSIYSFRGANYNNLNLFKESFKGYVEVFLNQNYRFSQNVLSLANEYISKISDNENELLKEGSSSKGFSNMVGCINEKAQDTYIIEKITEFRKNSPNASIGIFFRRRTELNKVAKMLKSFGIEFNSLGGENIFSKPIIKLLLHYLEVIDNPKEANINIFEILNSLPLRRETVRKIGRKSSMNEKSFYNVLMNEDISDYGDENEIILKLRDVLRDVVDSKGVMSIREIVYKILVELNIYEKALIYDSSENISLINAFLEFCDTFSNIYKTNSITKFLKMCEYSKNLGIESNQDEGIGIKKYGVELLTVHQAKGREYDYVIMPFMNEKRFPLSFKPSFFTTPYDLSRENFYDEEERLFFVAITRAKEGVEILSVKKFSENKTESQQSIFISSLKTPEKIYYTQYVDELSYEKKLYVRLEIIKKIQDLLIDGQYSLAKKEIDLLRKLFGKKDLFSFIGDGENSHPDYSYYEKKLRGESTEFLNIDTNEFVYSVSQLQVYDSCPKKYLFQYIYKVPTQVKHYFDFGTTMHKVLEEITKEIDISMPKEIYYSKSVDYLNKFWISKGYDDAKIEKEYFEKGISCLKDFIEREYELRLSQREIIGWEKKFNIEIDGKKITGVIDRVDKNGEDLEILDYKTSNSMEKDLNENMQLIVYAMAMKELYEKYPSSMGLWYLIHNKISKVYFNSKNLDIVKMRILDIIKNIEKKDFKATPNGFACKYCDFNKICPDSMYK